VVHEARYDVPIYEGKNKLVLTFEKESALLPAREIHLRIQDRLNVEEIKILVIRTEGPKRQMCINFEAIQKVDIMNDTNECVAYKHAGGQRCPVMITLRGLGVRNMRIADLPLKSQQTQYTLCWKATE
jgi:hypothetical protein